MKKICAIAVTITLMLLLVGCSVKGTNSDYSSNNDIITHYYKLDKFNCPQLNENTININSNYFINNNDVYEYSLNKVYSTSNNNCDKVDTLGKEIVGISYNGVYDDNYYLYSENSDFKKNMKYEHEKAREYFLKKSFPNSSLQLWLITTKGIVVENNKLYYTEFDYDGNHSNEYEIELNTAENIIGIYGQTWDVFHVETTSSYYDCLLEVVNKEELQVYADAECKEKFICLKSEDFDYEQVKKYLGNIVILNNGDIYKYNKGSSSYSCP